MARRARWFLLAWVVIVVVGFAASLGLLGNEGLFKRLKADDAPQVHGESRTGADLIAATSRFGSSVQYLLDGVDPASAQVREVVGTAATDLAAIPHVAQVQQPFAAPAGAADPPEPGRGRRAAGAAGANPLVARDGHAVLIVVQLAKGLSKPDNQAATDAVTARLAQLPARLPGSHGMSGGTGALVDEINKHVETDLQKGEAVALPLSSAGDGGGVRRLLAAGCRSPARSRRSPVAWPPCSASPT